VLRAVFLGQPETQSNVLKRRPDDLDEFVDVRLTGFSKNIGQGRSG
jgi:hypothetical protein